MKIVLSVIKEITKLVTKIINKYGMQSQSSHFLGAGVEGEKLNFFNWLLPNLQVAPLSMDNISSYDFAILTGNLHM